jgi:hypothetical protein
MAHFAKVCDGKVVQVIVAEPEFFDTFIDSSPGQWIQTSYNTRANTHLLGGTPLRKNYAGIGGFYNSEYDAFHEPSPYPSWTLNLDTFIWEPPVPQPNDGHVYTWNEQDKVWEQMSE